MTRNELIKFICELYDIDECTDMISKQIYKYVTELGLNYLDIARALSFYVDVRKGNLDIKYGIGIVPYVIKDAKKYFEKLKQKKEEQQAAANKEIKINKIVIKYDDSKKTIKKHHIDLSKI